MLSGPELALLGRLDLAFRRPASGTYSGERRSPRAARSPEFSDFRPYVCGDDFRQIDWKAFARLEKLMLRLYVAEEEACLNVVLDSSGSMELGSPAKWRAAVKLAAALGFLGLAAMDRVQMGGWSEGAPHTQPLRGMVAVGRLWAFLQAVTTGGSATPADLTRLRWLRPGMTVLISDFLVEADWGPALAALRKRRQEVVLWQLLAPDEESPDLKGDLKLVDVEEGVARELTITPALVTDYQRALAGHRRQLTRAATSASGRFLNSRSTDDLEALMLAGLRGGVVKRG